MDSRETIDGSRRSQTGDRHKRLRIVIAGVLLVAFALSPPGRRIIDAFMRNDRCSQLEADMYDVIDRYKYDDSERFDIERQRVEARHEELSCSFSTYRMYTLEGRL